MSKNLLLVPPFILPLGTWSSPFVCGTSPGPRAWFSFTKIDASRAAIFGGWVEGHSAENDFYILNMKEWVSMCLLSIYPDMVFV